VYYFLGCYVVYDGSLPTFRRNALIPRLGSKSNSSMERVHFYQTTRRILRNTVVLFNIKIITISEGHAVATGITR
jgi:hypothetical protein